MKVLFAITTLVQVLVSCAMTVPETETMEAAQQQQQQQVRGGGGTSKKAHSTTTRNRDLQAGTGYSDLYTTTAVTTASVSSATGTLVVDSDKDLGYAFEYVQPPTVEQAAVSSDRYSDGNDVRATTKTVTVDTGGGRQGTGSRVHNYYSSRYYTSGKGGKKGSKGKGGKKGSKGKGGGSQTRRPTPSPTPSSPAPPTTRACTKKNTAGNSKRLADLTKAEASVFTDQQRKLLLDFMGPKNDTGIQKDQAKVDVTKLLNLTLPYLMANLGLGTVVDDLRELPLTPDDTIVYEDGNVLFLRGPINSTSDGDVDIPEITACVNGRSSLTGKTTYASSDKIKGTKIGIGGTYSSTGATQYSDGSSVKGYADSRGSAKKDPVSGEMTLEGGASFRGASNLFGNAFTGESDAEGSVTFDENGTMTKMGGSAQSKGETIGEFFSFTGDMHTEGTKKFLVNVDGVDGNTVLEGTSSADGNSVSKVNGFTTFTSSGSGSATGFVMLDASGVPFRMGGYARFTGSTTSPLFNFAFDGDAVSVGSINRNANGSYTFSGFSCLAVPEGCVYKKDGTYDQKTCIVPENFCVEGSCVLNQDKDGTYDWTTCVVPPTEVPTKAPTE